MVVWAYPTECGSHNHPDSVSGGHILFGQATMGGHISAHAPTWGFPARHGGTTPHHPFEWDLP